MGRLMELKLSDNEFKENFKKLLKALVEGEELDWFNVNKKDKSVNFLLGDWSVELHNDGTWSIG